MILVHVAQGKKIKSVVKKTKFPFNKGEISRGEKILLTHFNKFVNLI
jgi:hypothetical protein